MDDHLSTIRSAAASSSSSSTRTLRTHHHHHNRHHPDASYDETTPLPSQTLSPPLTHRDTDFESSDFPYEGQQPSKDNCDRRRIEDHQRRPKMPTDLVGKTVTPFLKEHIPGLYAPIGKQQHGNSTVDVNPDVSRAKNPNTKFCYRHRPESKCRRAADETKMGMIQRELSSLSAQDQQGIAHVWSLFSAAPAKHRDLMLQGIITQCCFPQLSTVSREVHEQLKIDFLTALPTELSYKILCHLDTVSLCRAAQVSRRWRSLADDNIVWKEMCVQHIARKCTRCGWGLPLLERKRLMAWNGRQQQQQQLVQQQHQQQESGRATPDSDEAASSSDINGPKRQRLTSHDGPSKRPKLEATGKTASQLEVERRFKDVYRQRFKVGANWKTGRCSIKTFKGHSNGVTCLQFDDNILATGSYDATIRIWDIETGEVMTTLRGHASGIRTLQFDDTKLISGSFDKTIKIWNWQTGECLSTLQCHTEGVLSVHFDGVTLASGSVDRTVKIFDFNTKQTFCLRGHTDWVNHVRIDSESRTVFSASDDLTVRLWDLDTKHCIKTFHGHVGQVQQVLLMPHDFEPDEVPSQDAPDNASVHSRRSASPTPPVDNLDARLAYGPSFTSDPSRPLPPRYMLTGGLDNTVRLWDTTTGKSVRSMFGHVEGIWGLVGDALRVVTGANDSVTKIWEPRSGLCERSFTGHAGPVTCVGLSDSRMASGSEDGEVRLYSFEDETALEERGTPS